MYHLPVLLHESVDLLNIQQGGVYVDVTFGGGGHSREILRRMDATSKLVAFDRDRDAQANLPADERLIFIPRDFQFIEESLKKAGITAVDGILADLGVSSHQFDTPERGFSFRFDAPLDMRMNTTEGITAADVLNDYEEVELSRLLWRYGEVENSRQLTRAIVAERTNAPLRDTRQLAKIAEGFAPRQKQSQYLAQVFQALRIEVNNEMQSLEALLQGSLNMLRPANEQRGGRLVVIAYHSLEDRMVKHFMRAGNFEGELHKDFYGKPLTPWRAITRKAVVPSDSEITQNPRARSAKLRAAEKIRNDE